MITNDKLYFGHKRTSKSAQVLKYLVENGRATNGQLMRITYKFGSRVHELRQEGFRIKCFADGERRGVNHYYFLGHVDDKIDATFDDMKKRKKSLMDRLRGF